MLARLIEWTELAPEVRHFVFDVPEVEWFRFEPGQFVSLSAPINGRSITRAYSLAGVADGNRFEICLNRVDGGLFSPWLFSQPPGKLVELAGPLGYFVWRKPIGDSILVATGTGIAPFRGMIRHAILNDGSSKSMTLVFGVRRELNVLYRDEFEGLAGQSRSFRFLPTLSRGDDSWSGRRGHVQEHVLEALGDRRDVDVYICGLKAMVDDLRLRLKAAGLDRKRIVYEKFD